MLSLSPNAVKVLERRYLSKDVSGKVTETIDQLFRRVAKHIAGADTLFDAKADVKASAARFLEVMTSLKFMPNSPTLMNAGKPLGQLSACFVLPVGDSMEEIFDAVKNAALIHKSGGGTGFSFSRLRPSGASVRSTGGVASGPISFMRVFNAATEAVKQGGTRRGANMGILRVDHPDILSFIQCKKQNTDITNFNISIGLTEAFMQAVIGGSDYELINPRTKKSAGRIPAAEVFDLIVDMAWSNGEPGIIFLDRLNRDNVTPCAGDIEATNPCGEQPLLPYESCNLGSINLDKHLVPDGEGYRLDEDMLRATVREAVHFLDNVIEVNKYPLDQIEHMTKQTRKIGLGVMGFADLLFKLGIAYNSEAGVAQAERVMSLIQQEARAMSQQLAKERGAFPLFGESIIASETPLRNATVTTIAPTGTISIICGASSGIEPLFAISFIRNVMDNDELPEAHPYFEEVAKKRGFYSPELMRRIASEGTLAHIDEIPEDIRRVFVTSHDISPEYHIRMQAMFQKYTDNAVSKTVNFAHDATREEVRQAYLLAFSLGCKGLTIYRDGSRQAQVLNIGAVNKDGKDAAGKEAEAAADAAPKAAAQPEKVAPRPRPEVTFGLTEKVVIGCGNLYITVNYDEQGVCEVFTNLGRAGGCPSQSEATSRLISTALRSGMSVDAVVEQLKGIRCHSTLRQKSEKGIKVLSCPDAIGRVLEKVVAMKNNGGAPLPEALASSTAGAEADAAACSSNCSLCSMQEVCQKGPEPKKNGKCPDCGSTMEHEGGCVICRGCGFSKCG